MAKSLKQKLYEYCESHIDLFKEKSMIAWDIMDKWRCPLQMASSLYDEMYDCICDYCEDHGIDMEEKEIDVEEVFCQ